jgi:regulator of ribonuclease activity A
VRIVVLPLRDFGGRKEFSGRISTVRVHEDNVLVRKALEEPGNGRVLVIDGDASMRFALVGDQLAALGVRNGWSGIVVNGPIRDSVEIAKTAIGVKALGTCPRKTPKLGKGERDVEVSFGEVTFKPGEYLYADEDGVIVAAEELK